MRHGKTLAELADPDKEGFHRKKDSIYKEEMLMQIQ